MIKRFYITKKELADHKEKYPDDIWAEINVIVLREKIKGPITIHRSSPYWSPGFNRKGKNPIYHGLYLTLEYADH